jgi:phosphatidylinositol glycan class W
VLVVPLLLVVTLFANSPGLLNALLLLPSGALLLLPKREEGTPLPSGVSPVSPPVNYDGDAKWTRPASKSWDAHDDGKLKESGDARGAPALAPLAAVSTWRAHMMLMTVLGILAVDFPVFPRELAKCETFGVSLV